MLTIMLVVTFSCDDTHGTAGPLEITLRAEEVLNEL
jgi:hypothetical protein